jgi:opacity protein-like surface antigen
MPPAFALRVRPLAVLVPTLALPAAPALAQPSDSATRVEPAPSLLSLERQPVPWTIELAPIVWGAAIEGDFTLGGANEFDARDINADEPSISWGGRALLRAGKLSLHVEAFHLANDSDNQTASQTIAANALTIPRGSLVDWEFEFTNFKGAVGYAFEPFVKNDDVTAFLDLYAGFRYADLSWELASPGIGSTSTDNAWAHPLIGARLTLDLPYNFEFGLESDIGIQPLGEETSFAWEILVGFQWEPVENVGVRFGFRHISSNFESDSDNGDENDFDFFAAGLYGSVVVRF